MEDTEHAFPPSKKRAAGREISKENPGLDDEENTPEQETGTFQRASHEVLATRKIVKVRRHHPPQAASTNPFASIRLVPSLTESCVKPTEVTKETQSVSEGLNGNQFQDKQAKKECDNATEAASTNPFASVQLVPPLTEVSKETQPVSEPVSDTVNGNKDETKQAEKECDTTEPNEKDKTDDQIEEKKANESGAEPAAKEGESSSIEQAPGTKAEKEGTTEEVEQDNGHSNEPLRASTSPLNSFQQLSSSPNAFTGLAGTGFSGSPFSFGTVPGLNDKPSSLPTFSFSGTSNGSSSLFGVSGAIGVGKSQGNGIPSMQEVPVETGEEKEKVVYTADSVLFEYVDGGWKERGKGELKVNCSTDANVKARLVMRARGNFRLILNASLYPDMKLTNMDKKGITFACMNNAGEGKEGLSTFALKFKDGSTVEEFRAVVNLYKGEKTTSEKSPNASDV